MHLRLAKKFHQSTKSQSAGRHPYNMHVYSAPEHSWVPPSPPGSDITQKPPIPKYGLAPEQLVNRAPSLLSSQEPIRLNKPPCDISDFREAYCPPKLPEVPLVVPIEPPTPPPAPRKAPIKVERESCYDSRRREMPAGDSRDERIRRNMEELKTKNSLLQHEVQEKAEEARTERAEKEIHLKQRLLLQEQLEQLQARNQSLSKSLESAQLKQQQRESDFSEHEQQVRTLQQSLDQMRAQLVTEQNRRKHCEEQLDQLEYSYATVRERVVSLKQRYNRELQDIRQLVEQLQADCTKPHSDTTVDIYKAQIAEERQRIKVAMRELEGMQRRHDEGLVQLQAAMLDGKKDVGLAVAERLAEILRAAKGLYEDKTT